METGLLIFAIIMACGAVGTIILCGFAELREAIDINRRGWRLGHHAHARLVGHR